MRILIIEDDHAIASNLYDYLSARGHAMDAAADGATGLHLALSQIFDAIVLDIGLPAFDGLTLCKKLRVEAHVDTPILLLTARDTLQDKLHGFDSGADDYLVKPFALKELEARLVALHKRHSGHVTLKVLSAGDLTLNQQTLEIRFAGTELKLPPKAVRLLATMIAEPERLFTRDELETAVWGDRQETSDTLRSHLRILRRTLIEAAGYDPIKTVHGLGYRLVPNAPTEP